MSCAAPVVGHSCLYMKLGTIYPATISAVFGWNISLSYSGGNPTNVPHAHCAGNGYWGYDGESGHGTCAQAWRVLSDACYKVPA